MRTVIVRADSGYGMLRAGEKSTHHAKPSSSPAQPWSVMPTVLPRFLQTPRWHACCEEEQQARQRPLRCRLRDLDLLVPRRPPGLPRMSRAGQARHGSCSNPGAPCPPDCATSAFGGTRLPCGSCTASTVDAGLVPGRPENRRGPRPRGSVVSIPHGIDLLLHMLPAAFFLPPKRTPQASPLRADRLRPETLTPMNQCKHGSGQALGTPPCQVGPQRNRVAFGHLNARLVRPSLRLGGGGNRAPHGFSGSFFSRALSSSGLAWVFLPGISQV